MSIRRQHESKNNIQRGIAKKNSDGKLVLTRFGKLRADALRSNLKISSRPIFIKSTTKSPKVKSIIFVCVHGFATSALLMVDTSRKIKKHISKGGELPVSLSLKTAGIGWLDVLENQEKFSHADLIIYVSPAVKNLAQENKQHPKKWQKAVTIKDLKNDERSDIAFREILDYIRKKP